MDFQKAGFFLQYLAIRFSKKWTSAVLFVEKLAHILVCIKCQDTMAVKNFVLVAGMKKTFFAIFDPT